MVPIEKRVAISGGVATGRWSAGVRSLVQVASEIDLELVEGGELLLNFLILSFYY